MILGIESSCDESALALFDSTKGIVWESVYSQIATHKVHGGVVPELAVREHLRKFPELMAELPVKMCGISEIAVTVGPGLVGSLSMGMALGKALAVEYGQQLMGVNHLRAHAFSVFLPEYEKNPNSFDLGKHLPHLGLLVSGGNTILYEIRAEATSIPRTEVRGYCSDRPDKQDWSICDPKTIGQTDVPLGGLPDKSGLPGRYGCSPGVQSGDFQITIIAKTLDDAAGEALDKGAKMLGLPYPGGPMIEKLASTGNPDAFAFPLPFKESSEVRFSFSGLKTSLRYRLQTMKPGEIEARKADLAASYQKTVVECLALMVKRALKKEVNHSFSPTPYPLPQGGENIMGASAPNTHLPYYRSMGVCGGVSQNSLLRTELAEISREMNIPLLTAHSGHCGDNAAMIAFAAHMDKAGLLEVKSFEPTLGIAG
jgi:N6-L-threonylcarbamoyladenine synthase